MNDTRPGLLKGYKQTLVCGSLKTGNRTGIYTADLEQDLVYAPDHIPDHSVKVRVDTDLT